jgi:L-seryl-tRNA(Ser) seleniumtransferase
VNRILEEDAIVQLIEAHSRDAVLDLIRQNLDEIRVSVSNGAEPPDLPALVAEIEKRSNKRWRAWPERVINATGVILHTNLGRAPLSDDSIQAMQRAASGYSDLEMDLETGKRGSRQSHISQLMSQVTGAEAALVVNNNASAIMLGLAALAVGKEVIVSRGEAVEIGGGFRIPDVLRQSGATLVEVGTTNRTYARDFDAAITENTGAILSVHASNFKVMGFTSAPTLDELVEVGERRGVPVLHDLGSGCLLDTTPYGLAPEPMPQQSVSAGVELGFFSGDKLLGGPQAGIIIGKKDAVARASSHPLARAIRIDKMSMAALAATVLHYIRDEATSKIPIWRMISATEDELRKQAEAWADVAPNAVSTPSRSAIGGGSLPGETLPTWVTRIPSPQPGAAETMAQRLRSNTPPIVARIEDDAVILDPRTVLPTDESDVRNALKNLARQASK